MNKKELEFIRQEGEGLKIEFKETFDPKSLAREIVAFANSEGGRIFLGISDDKKIKGIHITNKLKSQVQDLARNCDPQIKITLEESEKVLIISVGEGKDKPYKCSSGFYLRQGASSQKMSRDRIIEFSVSEGKIKFDKQINEDFDFKEDFDEEGFEEFLRRNGLFTGLDKGDVLVSLGLAGKEGEETLMNNAGILFFARNPQKFFLHAYLDCVLFKGKDKTNIIDRKTFRSGLLDQLSSAKEFLMRHLNLGYEFEGFERRENYEIPLRALEEALVNALMHRDYFFEGANISLFIYDDRVEIISPGGLPKGLDKQDFGKLSIRRNQLIADIFSKTPYVEQIGSGIKRMRILLKEAGLPPPKFEFTSFFTITFKRRGLPDEPLTEPLTEPLKKIVMLIKNMGKINRKNIMEELNLSRATATRQLSELKKKGLIYYVGSKKSGHYQLKLPDKTKELIK